MGENTIEKEEASRSLSISANEADQVEEAMRRLRICPTKELESLSDLRIEKSRIKPLGGGIPKSGGKSDVEAASLLPAQSADPLESNDENIVAVKKLRMDDDSDEDRILAPFAYEIKLLNEISDENIFKIIGFVEDIKEGVAWMVFAWEKNGNLREFVRSEGWELPERLSLIHDVASGLSYLHGRNPPICHGDLKSLNILVNGESRAIITDFGSARPVEPTSPEATVDEATEIHQPTPTGESTTEPLRAEVAATGEFITMTGPAWTVRWAAPELLAGRLPCLASDMWAFGWICWEAITGNFPFSNESDAAIVSRVVKGDIPNISGNAQLQDIKALCTLMMECWSFDGRMRPTADKCQKSISWMSYTVPSRRDGNDTSSTRSSMLLYKLGYLKLDKGLMSEAKEYFQQSLEVAISVGDEKGNADALWALGEIYRLTSENPKALDFYSKARDVYSRIGDRFGVAESVRGMGSSHWIQGEDSKAESSFTEARDIYSQIGSQYGFARSLQGLGDVYRLQREYAKAEDSYAKARDIFSQIGDQLSFAQSIQGLGRVYSTQDKYSKAEESYSMARRIFIELGGMDEAAHNLWYLGWLYRDQARYKEAESRVREASAMYRELGLDKYATECDEFLEEVHQLMAQ